VLKATGSYEQAAAVQTGDMVGPDVR